MLQMLLPIQLPTSWDAVFIEFSLAHFLWLSYQPTRASSFLKYSANLKEESRFWEKIWFFPQAFQRTAQIVDHWGFVKLEFCETWSILWKQKIENSFSSAHVCLPLLLRNEGLFPVLTWRQYSMERSWRYWNCLSQTFFSIRLKAFQFPSGVSWGIYFQGRREECQKWKIVEMSPLFQIILLRWSCWFKIINKA